MKRLELGLTDQEREQRDQARRTRNASIAVTVIMLCLGVFLYWMGGPP